MQATWDFISQYTPVQPSYPGGGSLIIGGTLVGGPTNSTRFQLSIPVYTGYRYEIYGNPALGAWAWSAQPSSLSQTGAINANTFTASSSSTLNLYLTEKTNKGFYYVTFRVPGANTGTP